MNKTLTKRQRKEVEDFLKGAGATPEEVAELLKPSRAHDTYLRFKNGIPIPTRGEVFATSEEAARAYMYGEKLPESPPPKAPEKPPRKSPKKARGRPRKEGEKMVTISLQVEPELLESFKKFAASNRRTVSAEIRMAMDEHLGRVKR